MTLKNNLTTYKLSWIDLVGFYTMINASSKEEAIKIFESGELDSIEPDGNVTTDCDSLSIEELKNE